MLYLFFNGVFEVLWMLGYFIDKQGAYIHLSGLFYISPT